MGRNGARVFPQPMQLDTDEADAAGGVARPACYPPGRRDDGPVTHLLFTPLRLGPLDGMADLVGLARVLFADPLWSRKARGEVPEPIRPCTPSCSLCTKRVVARRPAYCGCWPKERRERFLARVGG